MGLLKPSTKRVLVIGDTHAPFTHKEYLKHCKKVYKEYKCNHVIHIGDELDHHAASYHETDVNGLSATEELRLAIDNLAQWHKAFPNTDVIIGNHTRMILRKANTAGIPLNWLREYKDVLRVPTWNFHIKLNIDGVLYIHGEGVTARTMANRVGRSVVQGHRHTEGYVWYHNNGERQIFGMQVGTGIDADSYAFAYAKNHPDAILSCGVVIDGKMAHVIPMV